jgi:2-C-methyl-D-erythritol 4-phosphate cytidylyltransferase
MLGLIVLTAENGTGLAPHGLFDPLLGAPLLARAIACALPSEEAVTGVLVVPGDLVARAKADVVDKYGLDEIDRVVAGGPDRRAALLAGLEALPSDVDVVLVQEGARVLVPTGLPDRVAAAARAGEAAAPAQPLRDLIVADDEGSLVSLDVRPRLRVLQGPQAFRVAHLREALARDVSGALSEAEAIAVAGGSIAGVPGDDDNLLLRDGADVSRALEVYSRRAVDYAFVYPRDLLPDDPLRSALDPGEARSESSPSPASPNGLGAAESGPYDEDDAREVKSSSA